MAEDPRTPILVGVGAVTQREADPARAREPLALMALALERAAEDAGSRALLARADSIRAPRGFWSYPDPVSLARRALRRERRPHGDRRDRRAPDDAARDARRPTSRRGAPTSCWWPARRRVIARSARARRAAPRSLTAAGAGDTGLRAAAARAGPERSRGACRPRAAGGPVRDARERAARRAKDFRSKRTGARSRRSGRRSRRSRPAIPTRGRARARERAAIADAGRNPMLAFPYGKLHCSQWNVDQAAGLVFCSRRDGAGARHRARSLDLPARGRRMRTTWCRYTERRELHRCAGLRARGRARLRARRPRPRERHASRALLLLSGRRARAAARARRRATSRPLTVTGGMAFAGGPLNHFVLQALVRMAGLLRAAPGSTGLVTAISGVLTKQGVSLWSSEPGSAPFGHDDVSEATARATRAAARRTPRRVRPGSQPTRSSTRTGSRSAWS